MEEDIVSMMTSGLDAVSNPISKLLADISNDSSTDGPEFSGPSGGARISYSAEFTEFTCVVLGLVLIVMSRLGY